MSATVETRRLLSIVEASVYMGISKRTLHRMIQRRQIPFLRIGRLVKLDVYQIEKWISKRSIQPAA
jgi:excisionase family DNA binding protein